MADEDTVSKAEKEKNRKKNHGQPGQNLSTEKKEKTEKRDPNQEFVRQKRKEKICGQ
jgi:hypothetical protein